MPIDDLGDTGGWAAEPVDYDPFTPAYHGTTAQFDEFSPEPSEGYMPDRMLGHHFAADPAVSNAFVMDRYNDAEHGVKPGGRIIPVNLPQTSQFLDVPQPQHDWAQEAGHPVTNRNIETDQTAISKMIARTAFPQRPDYLARSLQDNLALPEDEAHATAARLIQGGTVRDGQRDYKLNEYLNNRQGAFPFDREMKRDMTRIAREGWQQQGYKGLRYTNTSPMETMPEAGVKDPTSYVVFHPSDVAPRFGSPLMAPRLVGHPNHQLHDPYAEPLLPQVPAEEGQYAWGGRVGLADGATPNDWIGWLGNRVGFADGGDSRLGYSVTQDDINRAKGFREPRSPMHDRILAASQDEPEGAMDPSIAAHAAASAPESWAHYAGNPEHPMWRRIGAAGVEEASRMGHGLWSAATLPGDIATGKTTMEDPDAQRRAMDLAAGVTLTPAGEVPEGALTAGMRRRAPRRPMGELPEVTSTYEPPGWEAKAAELKPPPAELKTTDTENLSMLGHNKGPAIEQPLVNKALPSFDHPDFPEGRIATSVPTSAARGEAAHNNNSLQIGMDLARENPETYRKNADVIRGYDWLRLPENATDDQAHEALINHVQKNLVAVYDAIHPDIRPTSSLWYDGANQIVNGMAHEFGRRPENAAGLVAALSPQRDWFMNVENARRVADVLHHQKDMPVSAAMEQWGRNYANSRNPNGRVTPDMVNAQIDGMIGKPLSEMTPIDKAFYVRMYDAAHGPHPSRVPVDAEGNPRPDGYYILNPDGSSTGRVARTNSGGVKRLTWGSGGQLANAIRAFEAEDMPTISRAMGNRHKVRNFYNNNAAPNSASGATTIDTHAIAGGLLQPLGASAPEVEHGLGMKGSKFNGNGSSGLYPNYFEGYRRAAQQISKRPGGPTILPRQLQSITWEGIRGLFNPAERSNPSFIESIKNLWRAYKQGRMSLRNVLQTILRNPETGESRIRPPQWVTGDDRVEDEGD